MKKIRETVLGILLWTCIIVFMITFVLGIVWPKTELNYPWLISAITFCIMMVVLRIA